jgi:hypothetical protein
MKTAKITLLALLLTIVPFNVFSQSTDPHGGESDVAKSVTLSSAAFTTVALSTSRTFDPIRTQGFRELTLSFTYVYSAATAVTMTCQHALTSSDTYKDIDVLTYSGSTASSAQHTWSRSVTASDNWSWTLRIRPEYNYLKCTIVATSGGAGDTLTLTAAAR